MMFAKVMECLLGDWDQNPQKRNKTLDLKSVLHWDSLSELFPYESYDEEYGIYLNKGSYGFVLESNLLIGSNDQTESDLTTLFRNILPVGSNIQFMLVASPKVGDILDNWCLERDKKSKFEIIKDLSNERKRFLTSYVFNQYGRDPYVLRDFRLIISWSRSGEPSDVDLKYTQELQSQISTLLNSSGMSNAALGPQELINLLSDLIVTNDSTDLSSKEWNQYDSISNQIVNPSTLTEVKENGLFFNEGKLEARCYSASRFPVGWHLWGMSRLIGDNLNNLLKIPCAFVIHYGVHIVDNKLLKSGLMAKAGRVEAQANSPLGKWLPGLRKEAEEWSFVRGKLEENERLIRSNYQVILFDNPYKIATSEQHLRSLYSSNGWELTNDRYIQLPSFIASIPMIWGSGMCHDLGYFRKLRTSISYECSNLLPIQGEFKGGSQAGMLLAGRRGQLYYWSPYGSSGGNYNISVVGRSGSGKSVFMQELATSVLGMGGSVYVLDVGRSFEKQVKAFQGQFIEFGSNAAIVLNPFNTIDSSDSSNVDDSLSILKPIVSLMIAPKAGTTDEEDALIEYALRTVWQEKGTQGEINDLYEWFNTIGVEKRDRVASSLGKRLYPYSSSGAYGRFFNGKSTVNFDSAFVVTELQELKERKDLQSVVVQIFMLLITNKIIKGDRKNYSSIMFDEAWDLLRGKQGGEFIEALARTLRKFNGSLVVGTQTINDFYSSPGAEAAFNNSDWLCMFSQKKESIELLSKSGKFAVDDYHKNLLGTIQTKQGEYSELMISHESGMFIGRLIIDPFSRILYSTKAEEYTAVKALEADGYELRDAIRTVASSLPVH